MKQKVYKTLAKLKAAIDSGELKLEPGEALTIDNDSVCLYIRDRNSKRARPINADYDDDDDNQVKVFDNDPVRLLEQALDLLGIPHEAA
jgi:hypothetical protein